MLWLDAALVTVTIGTALILISPLARIMGIYGPTKLVPHGFVLGMYGRPTWRFWALTALFFAVHSAWHFEKGKLLSGGAWAAMTGVYLVFVINAVRSSRTERESAAPAGDAPEDERE
jgi:hypothetical protein